ncbi:TPA: hypothetical protein ACNBO9_005548, partial [Escherichia coli]
MKPHKLDLNPMTQHNPQREPNIIKIKSNINIQKRAEYPPFLMKNNSDTSEGSPYFTNASKS